MTVKELADLRKSLINGDNNSLSQIYNDNKKDCIDVMLRKQLKQRSECDGIYTDAIMVFRDNVINGKITKLSSAKAYILSTCINMAKENITYQNKKLKKEDAVRLLFYEKNHYVNEDKDLTDELIAITQTALKKLSDDCQRIIIAFYVYKISMKELAEEFGLNNADVVKTKKMRCYKSWIKKTKSLMHF